MTNVPGALMVTESKVKKYPESHITTDLLKLKVSFCLKAMESLYVLKHTNFL